MKTGLVLEGGAMRGMFTCGVLDVFLENDITFDGAIGVSAGAVFGCNLKSKQAGRALRYNKKYCNDKRYASFRSLLTTGDLYGVDFCYNDIPNKLDLWDDVTFRENPMEFYVVCTDVDTGRAVYHKCSEGNAEDIQWFRASASMPIVSRVVNIGNRNLLDGGIGDSIPLRFFEHKNYDRNVVVLTQPLDYVKKKNKMLPIARVVLKKYPKMIKAIENRHLRYNATTKYIRERELAGDVYVIRPKQALSIGSTEKNPDELERVYQMGREAAIACLDELREFISK